MLCDNLEGWDGEGGGRGFRREGSYGHLWLNHVDVQQKTTHYCKSVILQLKKTVQHGKAASLIGNSNIGHFRLLQRHLCFCRYSSMFMYFTQKLLLYSS